LTPVRIEVLPVLKRPQQALREHFLLRYHGTPEEMTLWRGQWAELASRESYMIERKSKNGPKPTNLRPLVAEAKMEGEDSVLLTLDWATDYMSPVALVRAVNNPISALSLSMIKTGQEFAE
jgi:hypothetical protein